MHVCTPVCTPSFLLTSYGHGVAYDLKFRTVIAGEDFIASRFFQGDDALMFEEEMFALSDRGLDDECVMAELWERYT